MTLIAAPPPGPIAGQPGHFAHHDWIEASLKLLALPPPQTMISATSYTLSTVWSGNPNMIMAFTNPDPSKLLQVLIMAAAQMSPTVTVEIGTKGSGATTFSEGNRAERGYVGPTANTAQPRGEHLRTLNPGVTNIQAGGLTNSATQPALYWYLRVLPVGWV
jgi:hypothetical protein